MRTAISRQAIESPPKRATRTTLLDEDVTEHYRVERRERPRPYGKTAQITWNVIRNRDDKTVATFTKKRNAERFCAEGNR